MVMSDKQYVETKGIRCPICKSTSLGTNGGLDQDDIYIYQDVVCYDCGAEYNDRYVLEGYYEEKTDKAKEEALDARKDEG